MLWPFYTHYEHKAISPADRVSLVKLRHGRERETLVLWGGSERSQVMNSDVQSLIRVTPHTGKVTPFGNTRNIRTNKDHEEEKKNKILATCSS